jgi:hypothetical protein
MPAIHLRGLAVAQQHIRLMLEHNQGDHVISAYDDVGQVARAVSPDKARAIAKCRRRTAEALGVNEADLRFTEWDIAASAADGSDK